jgi:cation/acetate symporter
VDIPVGFLLGYLDSVTSKDPEAETHVGIARQYDELEVRSLTGAGAEQAVPH